jgi:hypothetical protein
VRHEAHGEAERLRDLRRVLMRYADTFSSTNPACELAFSSRPAPETPDFASTTTFDLSIASTSGASARIAAVA